MWLGAALGVLCRTISIAVSFGHGAWGARSDFVRGARVAWSTQTMLDEAGAQAAVGLPGLS